MTWARFWHWLITSRYTRRLEWEIESLLTENERLRRDNLGLQQALTPALRQIRADAPKENTAASHRAFQW